MNNKISYRTFAKKIRKNLDIIELSKFFVDKLRENEHYISAKNVMIYYPLSDEIDLRELLFDNKNFYLPKISDENLLVCPYCSELICSKLNIMEPVTDPVSADILDLIIVPNLMSDKNYYRLGYGGGFYDRFLIKNPHIYKIALTPKELFVDKLPTNEYDVKMDMIIIN